MGKSISRSLDFIAGNDQFAAGDWQDLITVLGGAKLGWDTLGLCDNPEESSCYLDSVGREMTNLVHTLEVEMSGLADRFDKGVR